MLLLRGFSSPKPRISLYGHFFVILCRIILLLTLWFSLRLVSLDRLKSNFNYSHGLQVEGGQTISKHLELLETRTLVCFSVLTSRAHPRRGKLLQRELSTSVSSIDYDTWDERVSGEYVWVWVTRDGNIKGIERDFITGQGESNETQCRQKTSSIMLLRCVAWRRGCVYTCARVCVLLEKRGRVTSLYVPFSHGISLSNLELQFTVGTFRQCKCIPSFPTPNFFRSIEWFFILMSLETSFKW